LQSTRCRPPVRSPAAPGRDDQHLPVIQTGQPRELDAVGRRRRSASAVLRQHGAVRRSRRRAHSGIGRCKEEGVRAGV
jgi:hypothetical protein